MACSTCNSKVGCNCSDTAFKTVPTFQCLPDTNCPNPEVCSEFTDANCVLYSGYGIVNLDISTGDRFNSIVQKLVLLTISPGCVGPDSTCLAIDNLNIFKVTNTTITPQWSLVSSGVNYQVEYKLSTATSWTLNPLLGPTITGDIINPPAFGLLPNTNYHVRVNTFCPPVILISDGGTGYAGNGTHTGVTFTGGSGTGMIGTIVITAGIVTSVTITTGGSGYAISDVLVPLVGSGIPALTNSGTPASLTIDTLGNCYSVTLLVKTLV